MPSERDIIDDQNLVASTDSVDRSLHHSMYWVRIRVVALAVSLVVVTALTCVLTFGTTSSSVMFSYPEFFEKSSTGAVQHEQNCSCSPQGIHLALRSDVDESGTASMTVSFYLPYSNCSDARPVVSYGKKGKERRPLSANVPDPLHLKYTSRKTNNKTILSDWVYHVELFGLEAGERDYWYRIDICHDACRDIEVQKKRRKTLLFRSQRQASTLFVGHSHYFRTPPLLGSPTSFAIVGDVGDTKISHRTIQGIEDASLPEVNKHPVTLAIIAGDIAYADAAPWLWTRWFRNTEYLFQRLPLSVAVGNHEVEVSTKLLAHDTNGGLTS